MRGSVLISTGALLVLVAMGAPLQAQMVVKLAPQTVAKFDSYARKVEAALEERWAGKKNFLSIEDSAQTKQSVLSGELYIKQVNGHPMEIPDGLIHDWAGAIYMPNTSIQKVVGVLEDFDRHKDIYPSVSKSRTLRRDALTVTGYWRLQQKGMVPVTLDVEQEAHYSEVSPGKWKGENYARNITEIGTGLFDHGRKYPLGEGHGYLWRLYGYWSLEAYKGGVLAECRTLSLSRDVPEGLAWAVMPYVQKMPEESLSSTLTETRKAAEQPGR